MLTGKVATLCVLYLKKLGLWLTLGEHQYQAEIIIHFMSYLIIILG